MNGCRRWKERNNLGSLQYLVWTTGYWWCCQPLNLSALPTTLLNSRHISNCLFDVASWTFTMLVPFKCPKIWHDLFGISFPCPSTCNWSSSSSVENKNPFHLFHFFHHYVSLDYYKISWLVPLFIISLSSIQDLNMLILYLKKQNKKTLTGTPETNIIPSVKKKKPTHQWLFTASKIHSKLFIGKRPPWCPTVSLPIHPHLLSLWLPQSPCKFIYYLSMALLCTTWPWCSCHIWVGNRQGQG